VLISVIFFQDEWNNVECFKVWSDSVEILPFFSESCAVMKFACRSILGVDIDSGLFVLLINSCYVFVFLCVLCGYILVDVDCL
jgi:hypothetical protein